MSVFDPKCRMVTFRLSAAEYEAAQEVCKEYGYRSISLLARLALLSFHPRSHPQPDCLAELEEMRQEINSLRAEVRQINKAATKSGPTANIIG